MNMQSFTKAKLNLVLFSVLSLISFASLAADNSALNVFSSSATANGGQNYSLSLQTLILLTALSFLPTIVSPKPVIIPVIMIIVTKRKIIPKIAVSLECGIKFMYCKYICALFTVIVSYF
jgi:flagellar biosynthesis protein FliP